MVRRVGVGPPSGRAKGGLQSTAGSRRRLASKYEEQGGEERVASSKYSTCVVHSVYNCMVSLSAALRVRYVVCGSWDPLALLRWDPSLGGTVGVF